MGWGRYLLLGNLGQQLDIQDRQRETDTLRQQLDSQWSRDQSQDQQIDLLKQELRDLKLYVAAIVKHLAIKNLLDSKDVEEMVRAIEGNNWASRL